MHRKFPQLKKKRTLASYEKRPKKGETIEKNNILLNLKEEA